MKIIIDERENLLWGTLLTMPIFENIQFIKQVLPLGDIILQQDDGTTISIMERKTLNDLLSSIKDGRYEEQSYRLKNTTECPIHNIIYLIEGNIHTLSIKDRRLIFSSTASLHFFKGFQVSRTNSIQESAEYILYMTDKLDRNLKKKIPLFHGSFTNTNMENILITENLKPDQTGNDEIVESQRTPDNYCSVVKKVKKDNITPDNIGEIILCQIPGISSVTAIAIMKKFSNFTHFLDELRSDPNCLNNIQCESKGKLRKINKSCIENLKKFFVALPLKNEENNTPVVLESLPMIIDENP
jgi:ERCC4-type nuclease